MSRAYKLISDFEHWWMTREFDDDAQPDEEQELAKMELRDVLTRIHERLATALEFAALPNALDRMTKRFDAHAEELIALKSVPYVDVFFSPVLSELSMAYESFAACLGGVPGTEPKAERERQLLRQILIGTPKLIADRSLDPRSEADVRREIYGLLLHVFPDTVRDPPIPQVSKTYKPDIGIPHLQVAIEYKFCDTETDLKKCLEGIYADTKGYAGSKDWTNFLAVLYCTRALMTDAQLREEERRVGMPSSWELLLVIGQGERKTKRKGATDSQKAVTGETEAANAAATAAT
ncbi:MAG: hypothetical protein KF915_13110 [Polyangiaceae bacterium]|nr:hypothetical protein [Polyangiaceae bacterium]